MYAVSSNDFNFNKIVENIVYYNEFVVTVLRSPSCFVIETVENDLYPHMVVFGTLNYIF